MKNPTRDGMIKALRDAKISALMEISALEMAQGATNWVPFSEASDSIPNMRKLTEKAD